MGPAATSCSHFRWPAFVAVKKKGRVTAITDANSGCTYYNFPTLRSYHIHSRYVTYIPRCTVGGTISEIFLRRWKVIHDQQVHVDTCR